MEIIPAAVFGIRIVVGTLQGFVFRGRSCFIVIVLVKVLGIGSRVCEDTVADHTHIVARRLLAEFAEVLFGAEHGVDLLVVPGIVLVTGVGFEYRAEVDACHIEFSQIGKLLPDAFQIPAKEIVVVYFEILRFPLRRAAPVVAVGLAFHSDAGSAGLVEPVDENVVVDAAVEPFRRSIRSVVDCLLPGTHRSRLHIRPIAYFLRTGPTMRLLCGKPSPIIAVQV